MLFGLSTKKGAGLTLWGDYHDLTNLYETIYKISESVVLKGFMSDYVLHLCYQIRHAYQNMREQKKFGRDELSRVKYYGVKMLWPDFIIQIGLLRWAAAFITTDNNQQSNLFRLESILETTLKEASPIVAEECLSWLKSFHGFREDYVSQYLPELSYRFIFDETLNKKRINRLPVILRMTFELSHEYKSFKEHMDKTAKEKNCTPEELFDLNEWPEFTW